MNTAMLSSLCNPSPALGKLIVSSHELTGNTREYLGFLLLISGIMSLVIYPILAEHATKDESAVALRSISRRGPPDAMVQEKSKWSYYHKPIALIIFGGIVFLTGILYTIFYFTKYVDVPYALGPVFLSIGLMFLVTGLVWVPIVTEAVRHKGILRTIDTPRSTAT